MLYENSQQKNLYDHANKKDCIKLICEKQWGFSIILKAPAGFFCIIADLFQTLVIQRKAFNDILLQTLGSPNPEMSTYM
jgi:hypothetical protein